METYDSPAAFATDGANADRAPTAATTVMLRQLRIARLVRLAFGSRAEPSNTLSRLPTASSGPDMRAGRAITAPASGKRPILRADMSSPPPCVTSRHVEPRSLVHRGGART